MEEYSKYIFLAFAIAASLYRSFQKKKKANPETVKDFEPEESDVEYQPEKFSNESPLFENKEPETISNPSNVTQVAKPILENETGLSNAQIEIEEEEEQGVGLDEEFDLRKAVIYSTILNPPHL